MFTPEGNENKSLVAPRILYGRREKGVEGKGRKGLSRKEVAEGSG